MRAAEPRLGEIGVNLSGLRGRDGFDPIGEEFGCWDLTHQVGVIEMAVRVNETGEENRVTQFDNLFVGANSQVAPAADGPDAVSRNQNRAVVDGRPGDRQNDASAKYHAKACPAGFRTAPRFKLATCLAPGLLNR